MAVNPTLGDYLDAQRGGLVSLVYSTCPVDRIDQPNLGQEKPMQQLFIPSVFADIFPQYVHMFRRDPGDYTLTSEIHLLWRAATVFAAPGRLTYRMVKTGEEIMAGFGDFTFSTLRLEGDEAATFEKWFEETVVNPLEVMQQFTGDGFKMSVSYIIDQNSFCVTIIGTKDTKKHEKQGMTSWSDDLGEALAMAWFKHYQLCAGDGWPTKDRGNRWG